jgi:quinol-cytochrome oxidoreductase complex cytochrome b subunit
VRPYRHGLFRAFWELLRSSVPPGYRGHLAFGWLLMLLFVSQLVSGGLLSIYYHPSPAMVSESVQYIMRDIDWGWLVRGVHHWSGRGMIVLCVLQLLRVFLTGAYRGDGAAHWYLGMWMAGLIGVLTFSGELLVWDDEAYWTMTRALEVVESMPLVGETAALILRGGSEVTSNTLSRTYAAHAILLPWVVGFLTTVNLLLLARRARARREAAR